MILFSFHLSTPTLRSQQVASDNREVVICDRDSVGLKAFVSLPFSLMPQPIRKGSETGGQSCLCFSNLAGG